MRGSGTLLGFSSGIPGRERFGHAEDTNAGLEALALIRRWLNPQVRGAREDTFSERRIRSTSRQCELLV